MPKARLLLSLSDEEIVEMIRKRRWPEGVTCIYCGSKHVVRNGKPREKPYVQRYMCRDCGKQFNDLTGTPFSHTSLSPREVLTIAYLYFKLGMSGLFINNLLFTLTNNLAQCCYPHPFNSFYFVEVLILTSYFLYAIV